LHPASGAAIVPSRPLGLSGAVRIYPPLTYPKPMQVVGYETASGPEESGALLVVTDGQVERH